jgi:crotonobetainyl-CoA:carnitine CoA-transferase CaiB-like acyl-CoA transferase
MTTETRSGPLAGIRVIETATYVSGPFAGLLLGDMGAEVIKVEPPKGDPLRRFGKPKGPVSALFANCNRNKLGITLDLKEPSDRERLLDLVGGADVFLANWRPEAAARLGLDDETLVTRNQRLVRLYATGFGTAGPLGPQPAFDSTIQALSGLAGFQGDRGSPSLVKTYLCDKTTGLLAAQAVVAALFDRTRSSEGNRIDMTMLASAAYMNFPDMFADETFLDIDSGTAARDLISANQPVPASDGWLLLSPVTVAQIKRSCEAAGAAADIDRVLAHKDGTELTRSFVAAIAAQTPARSVAEWLEIFARHDVPAAPCLDNREHLDDPQVVSEGIYEVGSQEGLGRVRRVRFPASFSTSGERRQLPAPTLGQHNDSVGSVRS